MIEIKEFENNSCIIGEKIRIGRDFKLGANTEIRATNCTIGDGVTIGSGNKFLVGENLTIGSHTRIGNQNDVTGRSIELGEYIYWDNQVTAGQGGKFGPDSRLKIGSYTMICARIMLNLSDTIEIGEYVGIGEDVALWTHGSYLPILEGFPADFGPIKIGNRVWLPARSIVLPNRKIGNNVVIGIGSLINRDIPDGALAAGIPAKILRENAYPSKDPARDRKLVGRIIDDYGKLSAYKGLATRLRLSDDGRTVHCNSVEFRLDDLSIHGKLGSEEQDFRDFLRRRGIKFYNGDPFTSILPKEYERLLGFQR